MAAKSTTFDNDLLKLIFNGTTITGLAVNDTGTPLTNLYLSLHTTPGPNAGGDQTTNEVTVGAWDTYARKAVARSGAGWTVSTNTVVLAANQNFTVMGSGSGCTITHFAVGTLASGAGKVLYFGAVSPNITVAAGVTPQLTTGTTITET